MIWNSTKNLPKPGREFLIKRKDGTMYIEEFGLSSRFPEDAAGWVYIIEGKEDKPLELQSGKLFKTRDGRKAFVSCHRLDDGLFYGSVEKWPYTVSWDIDGKALGNSTNVDLVDKIEDF